MKSFVCLREQILGKSPNFVCATKSGFDFYTPGAVKGKDYWLLTRLQSTDLDDFLGLVGNKISASKNRIAYLTIFLMKLHTDLSQNVLLTLFILLTCFFCNIKHKHKYIGGYPVINKCLLVIIKLKLFSSLL